MPQRPDEESAAWRAKAAEDLEAAELLLVEAPHLASVVQFHAQQAAEKALKSLLVFLGRDVPSTHDLDVLAGLFGTEFPEIRTIQDAASWLAPFAVDARYPSFIAPDADATGTASRAVACAREITAAVDVLLGRE